MANYWAVTIGINQYQFFQPLRCAQSDAEVLSNFLVREGGLLTQRCLLFTDSSPAIGEKSTYPTKENILLWLDDLIASAWQPQDHLWLFFSGYGVTENGKDYLMPVEGHPQSVPETGIEVRSLMQSLQLAEINTLLLLDINRASSTQSDHAVGGEIAQLARELEIPTILSCQTDQFSHESGELGHGFFTAALLEALRSGNASRLKGLASYVSVLTPELSQQYWRPPQNPVSIFSFEDSQILPILESQHYGTLFTPTEAEQLQPDVFSEESFAVTVTVPPLIPKYLAEVAESVPQTELPASTPLDHNQGHEQKHDQRNSVGRFVPDVPKYSSYYGNSTQLKTAIWKEFLLWGGSTMFAVALACVVILRNHPRFLLVRNVAPSPTVSNTSNSKDKSSTNLTGQHQSNAQIAPKYESDKQNQALLELEKMSLKANQASDLSVAIASARKIQPDEPLYQQAQESIKLWSRMILDLAESRANQKQYKNAIAAAQLIPPDQVLYPQAEAAINQWQLEAQQYVTNQTLVDAAKALIQSGQASTYNRAIEVAKKVPPGQPGFELAQESIYKWSLEILAIAKTRANQGKLQAAIEAATLVPDVTDVHKQAQELIKKWQGYQPQN